MSLSVPALITRRAALKTALAAAPAIMAARFAQAEEADARFAGIEAKSGGRLGVAILDVASGRRFGHRENERFPMCSTFKCLASALVLQRVEARSESLDRRVAVNAADIVVNSPVTQARAGKEPMSMAELCEAAMTVSDNTAGNYLLASFGGPAALTAFARSLGDGVTRLDRIEPDLNEALPNDERDTTTPAAMAENLRRLVLGDTLKPVSRNTLIAWLMGNKTGDARLRAGLPKAWRVGDKTGSGDRGTTNDAGVVWPPGREPLIVSIYLTGSTLSAEGRNGIIADVGRVVAGL